MARYELKTLSSLCMEKHAFILYMFAKKLEVQQINTQTNRNEQEWTLNTMKV